MVHNHQPDRALGDRLVELICLGGDVESAANTLLAELFSGYPIKNLRRLLQSDNAETVKAGVWIASELGEAATPLLPDVAPLLQHSSSYVRFFALDVILATALPQNADVIAAAIHSIDDVDAGVRWKSMHFLAKATTNQLRASMRYLTDVAMASRVRWLLESVQGVNIQGINAAMSHDERIFRLFAVAAAARLARTESLQHAANAADDEVSAFAKDLLSRSPNKVRTE